MYNKEYYDKKKNDLVAKYNKKMESAINIMTTTLQEFHNDKADMVKEMQEISKIEQENAPKPEVKETKPEPKKK